MNPLSTFGKKPSPKDAMHAASPINQAVATVAPELRPSREVDGSRLGSPRTQPPAPPQQSSTPSPLASTLGTLTEELTRLQESLKTKDGEESTTEPTTGRASVLDQIQEAIGLNRTKGDRSAEIREEEGVFQKQQEVTNIENEYRDREQYYAKKAEELQKNAEGLETEGLKQKLDELERQKNSELADIAIRRESARGNYETAFNIAQQKIDDEFKPIEDEIDFLKTLYTLYGDDMSESQKMEAEQEIRAQEDELAFARQKELIRYREQIDQEFGGNSGTNRFTPTQLNEGALNAGLTLAEFQALDPEVQNYYVSSDKGEFEEFDEMLQLLRTGGTDENGEVVTLEYMYDVIDNIDRPLAVKGHLRNLVDAAAPENAEESEDGFFRKLMDFLND